MDHAAPAITRPGGAPLHVTGVFLAVTGSSLCLWLPPAALLSQDIPAPRRITVLGLQSPKHAAVGGRRLGVRRARGRRFVQVLPVFPSVSAGSSSSV
ncbi:hypothetical protein NDU88_003945 [Pleurodeles waltl]|uniref:Uncharacterized protein n=1 Tax=Pleurodeles waltl TaxID=8319 RepID=A0AAV7RJX2_PLEWA|nr:hypothetical protein NDU88_003945 [Pleurodeles waltl]